MAGSFLGTFYQFLAVMYFYLKSNSFLLHSNCLYSRYVVRLIMLL
jgi:hypothetical protein